MQGADDAAGDRVLVAVGVADRDHRLARHQVGRGADVDHRQLASGVDLDDGQVGLGVERSSLATSVLLVGQRDLDLPDAVDDVMVGEDVAAFVDDHAGAHAVDVLRTFAAAITFIAGRKGLLAVDVHDRGPRGLHDLDRGRGAQFRGRPVSWQTSDRCSIRRTYARNADEIGWPWRGMLRRMVGNQGQARPADAGGRVT